MFYNVKVLPAQFYPSKKKSIRFSTLTGPNKLKIRAFDGRLKIEMCRIYGGGVPE